MDTLYSWLLLIHGWSRWLVLLAAVGALVALVIAWRKGWDFSSLGGKAARIYVVLLDVQVTLGLALAACSPVIRTALSDMGATMKTKELRFFTVEHLLLMLLAVAAAHIGLVRARRATQAMAAHKTALYGTLLSLALIIAGIPWWRPWLR